jgi:hypothetical protein
MSGWLLGKEKLMEIANCGSRIAESSEGATAPKVYSPAFRHPAPIRAATRPSIRNPQSTIRNQKNETPRFALGPNGVPRFVGGETLTRTPILEQMRLRKSLEQK